MKNFKKLLAVLLSVMLLLSSMSGIVVFAEETTEETPVVVAKIGDVEYTDLQAAIYAAKEGDVITLTSDVTVTEQLDIPASEELIKNGDLEDPERTEDYACSCSSGHYAAIPANHWVGGIWTNNGKNVQFRHLINGSYDGSAALCIDTTMTPSNDNPDGSMRLGVDDDGGLNTEAFVPGYYTVSVMAKREGVDGATVKGGRLEIKPACATTAYTAAFTTQDEWEELKIENIYIDEQGLAKVTSGYDEAFYHIYVNGLNWGVRGKVYFDNMSLKRQCYDINIDLGGYTLTSAVNGYLFDAGSNLTVTNGNLVGDGSTTIFSTSADSSRIALDGVVLSNFLEVVAKIGDVEYTDLQDAIYAAGEGDVIEVLKDITVTEQLNIPASEELITNGELIDDNYTEDTTITWKDGQSSGAVAGWRLGGSWTNDVNAQYLVDGGKDGGSAVSLNVTSDVENARPWMFANSDSVDSASIVSGKYTLSAWVKTTGKLDGAMEIMNAEGVIATANVTKTDEWEKLEITDFYIDGDTGLAIYQPHAQWHPTQKGPHIRFYKGVNIKALSSNIIDKISLKRQCYDISIDLGGHTLTSAVEDYLFAAGNNVAISNGTIAGDGDATMLVVKEDSSKVTLENVTQTGIVKYVAQIGDTKYTDLQDAIYAAQTGDEIDIIEDITIAEPLIIPNGNNLIANGDFETPERTEDYRTKSGHGHYNGSPADYWVGGQWMGESEAKATAFFEHLMDDGIDGSAAVAIDTTFNTDHGSDIKLGVSKDGLNIEELVPGYYTFSVMMKRESVEGQSAPAGGHIAIKPVCSDTAYKAEPTKTDEWEELVIENVYIDEQGIDVFTSGHNESFYQIYANSIKWGTLGKILIDNASLTRQCAENIVINLGDYAITAEGDVFNAGNNVTVNGGNIEAAGDLAIGTGSVTVNGGNYTLAAITAETDVVINAGTFNVAVAGFVAEGNGYKFADAVYTVATSAVIADIDGDGIVKAADVIVIRKQLIGKSEDTNVYDINGDGANNVQDLVRIKKLCVAE